MYDSITYVTDFNYADWAGLYVNGNLAYEGHEIPYFAWEDAINSVSGQATANHLDVNIDEFGTGRLPETLAELEPFIRKN